MTTLQKTLVGALLALALPLAAGAQGASSTEPVISNVAASSSANGTGATIMWSTDVPANSQVEYGTTTNYTTVSPIGDSNAPVTNHSLTIGDLVPSTLYHFAVLSMATTSTATTSSSSTTMSPDQTFTTAASSTTASTTEPVISNIAATSTSNGTGATITWATDLPSDSQVEYGTTTSYGTFSALNDTLAPVTSHTLMISDLVPATLYHFAVISSAINTGTTNTSSDQTVTTAASSTATAATTTPVISNITVVPTSTTATIDWATDQPSTMQVAYGLTSTYSASTTLGTASTTSNSQELTGLTPSTTYHFQVLAGNGNGVSSSTDQSFTTLASAATSTGSTTTTSTSTSTLVADLENLQMTFPSLSGLIQGLINELLPGNTIGNSGNTPMIDQNGGTYQTGGTVDFGGHDFDHETNVTVTLNGTTVATAHADGGGNFSTGSVSLPTTAGTYTYVFTQADGGPSSSATVTVH